MLRIILKILTFTLPLFVNPSVAQEIWKESFSIPGKGFWVDNNGTIKSDFSGITTWTIDTCGIQLSDKNDYAMTVTTSGGRFECRDIDGVVTWVSEKIDISDFEKVNISLTAGETGSGNNIQTKYLKVFYKLDNSDELLFEKNGLNAGNWGSNLTEQFDLKGDTLQIICYISSHYASDKLILDEVTVWKEKEPSPPVYKNDVVINEILFNPFPGGKDYVEIFNRSQKNIATETLFIANRDKSGELNKIYPLTNQIYTLHPLSYLAITTDKNSLEKWYIIKCSACITETDRLPSYNNDEGYVVLLNEDKEIIDEFHYNEKLHSPFLSNYKGVSLERKSFSSPSNDHRSWHSASTTAHYGTPGYENSQIENNETVMPEVKFNQQEFSPNGDGFNDELIIDYNLDKSGYMANIKIFDIEGRFIMSIIKNEIMSTSGKVLWNGEDATGRLLPLGPYIIFIEFFNSEGSVYRFKDAAVLTGILD
ncbi:MAG: gliding motility-associated C-terminal domain-containing protein [Prolixibacteraceae bacterium]|nr:gliding motility-associated C-terminal domain-containing protein [Prolixibacteraceae bacterium]